MRVGRLADRAAARGPGSLPGTMPRLSGGGGLMSRVDGNCVFCKIVARQIPATVVYEDHDTLAFMDLGQVNPGHVLVAAKEHVENIYGLDDAQASTLLRAASRVALPIRDDFSPQRSSHYQANGKP